MRASLSLHFSSVNGAALRFLSHRRSPFEQGSNRLSYSRRKERICCPNTSAEATCDELVCKQTIYTMKKGMILSAALTVVGLMLVSCAGEPEATTTTTRQTTVTAVPPPASAQRTTTTTTHTGGY
jgi:hypothetical protein